MSAILQRLGARAIGQAWSVRSDARLPFADARLAEPAAFTPALAAAARPDRLAPTSTPLAASDPLQPAVPGPARHGDAPRRPAPQDPATLATPSDLGQRAGRAEAPASTEPAALPPLLAPLASLWRPAEDRLRATAVPAEVPDTLLPSLPPTLLPGTGRPAPERQGSPVWRAPSALPPRTAADPAPAQAPQGGETEVHIHIGRIEVTALQEAPRPKAKPRDRAQPMSLDAYLEQRRKAT